MTPQVIRVLTAMGFSILCVLVLVCLSDPSWSEGFGSSRDHALSTGFALERGR